MVKKNKIRSDNRIDIVHDVYFSSMIMNMLKYFNLGYLYYKKGVFDNIELHINEKKLISNVTYHKDKEIKNDTKIYVKNLYEYVDCLTEKTKIFAKNRNIDIIFEPSFSDMRPIINIFFMFQYKFKNVSDFEYIVSNLNMHKLELAKYMVIKYSRMVFAYDVHVFDMHMERIIDSIKNTCYTECDSCKKILDKITLIYQCNKCANLCCNRCHKTCKYC